MLEKDVVDNSKSCAEYFEFFKNYTSSVSLSELILHSQFIGNIQTIMQIVAIRLQAFDSKRCFCTLHGVLAWTFKVIIQTGMALIM